MRNVDSGRMGKKDLIKIETDLPLDFDVLGLLDPGITVSYVENGVCVRKQRLSLPERSRASFSAKTPAASARAKTWNPSISPWWTPRPRNMPVNTAMRGPIYEQDI